MKLSRLAHITHVLVKYGFADLADKTGLSRYLPKLPPPSRTQTARSLRQAENLRLALQELGPTFIKLGQFMSSRPDVFPTEYLHELEKLQDRVPPFPSEEAVCVVEEELGQPADEIFRSFSRDPVASASLAQVHAAVLPDNSEVVLKIQRPGIRTIIDQDIEILYYVAGLLNRYSELAAYFDFTSFVREFEQVIHGELDFTKEGRNTERLAHNLRYFDHMHVPAVFWEYTGRRILTLERIHGYRLTGEAWQQTAISRRHLAEELLEAYLKQMVEDGFFHADPHLGNLLLEPDGRLALVDLGIVGHLDANMKYEVGQLILAFANQEADRVTEVILRVGRRTDRLDTKALEQDVRLVTTQYQFVAAHELGMGRAIIDITKLAIANHIRLPQAFNLLGKTMFYIDLAIRAISPELDYLDFVRRSTQRVFFNLWRSQYTTSRMTQAMLESNRLAIETPSRLNQLLDRLLRDEIAIRFEHEHLEGMVDTLNRAANRLSVALIVASLVVASAWVIRESTGGAVLGFPTLGAVGLIVAGLIGMVLLVFIARSKL